MIVVRIFDGDPTPEDWKRIGEMIREGLCEGYEQPLGINWGAEAFPDLVGK